MTATPTWQLFMRGKDKASKERGQAVCQTRSANLEI
jgi:hypothetical protein